MSPRRKDSVHEVTRLSERIDHRTRLALFLKSSAFDFLLVLIVSVALTFTVSYGFESAAGYRGNVVLIVGITVPLLLALFLGSWSKRALVPSVVITVVLAVIIVAGAMVLMSPEVGLFTDAGAINDVEGNYVPFAIVAVVVPVIVYLLSRRTAGLVFLLILGVMACGVIQFLYRDWLSDQPGLPAAVGVLLGIAMLFVYQGYKQSVYSAKRVKRTSFFGAFGFSALVGMVCVAVGLAVFYGAVANLDLGTPVIKPFESYVARPTQENAGAYEKQDVYGDDTTDDTDDDMDETNQNAEGGDSESNDAQENAGPISTIGNFIKQITGQDSSHEDEDNESISYLILNLVMPIVITLLVLLCVGIIVFWHYRRKMRLKRIDAYPPQYRVWYLYTFLLERLRRLKIVKPDHLTPLEFAIGFEQTLAPFTRDTGGVDFAGVTGVYMDACYGGGTVSLEDYERVVSYYRAFFKNARRHVGWPKWVLWKFWRI